MVWVSDQEASWTPLSGVLRHVRFGESHSFVASWPKELLEGLYNPSLGFGAPRGFKLSW